ncbi:MAG: hypothetical protein LBR88_11020 [Zoogloeaceae bacterium]|nr:hypothetical protein [Zoogloeaceae bacterium]
MSFHGGVPAEKRPALLERFQNDPACRVFLSTDAGATGLNLQHASTLVKLPIPGRRWRKWARNWFRR